MAKRKRLTPADPARIEASAPEVKSAFGAAPAPIASVAGEAAAEAALREVAGALEAARSEGRLLQNLPLEANAADYLTRDRMVADPGEMAALKESLAARGQQTPIEVADLGAGRFGLISGWRRLHALRALAEDHGGVGTVQALIRQPAQASDAYVAMVEENEIRADLSYFERARIALKAVEQGVFPDTKAALLALFSTASRAKRSKIRSFLPVVAALDGHLAFPNRLTERLGLTLARAFEQRPGLVAQVQAALAAADRRETAEAEQALILEILKGGSRPRQTVARREIRPGVFLAPRKAAGGLSFVIEGPEVTEDFGARLEAFLKGRT